MSFLDSLKALFGGSKKPAAPAPAAAPAANQQQGQQPPTNNSTVSRPTNRQVFEGRRVEAPEWAQGLSASELIGVLKQNNKCKFVPLFEMKTIMTTKVGPDGNLVPEYNGVAGSCGAVKAVGMKVAQQNGMQSAYRYFDLNNAYRCCCDNPKKCPFYLNAVGENETVNARRH